MYDLKTSHDYEVPEHMQINAQKKRQQMVLLEGSIHRLKVDFNNKILELKHRKKDIISQVDQMNNRIQQINKVLNLQEDLFLPSIDEKVEYPQKQFDINDKEIEEFKQLKIQREIDAQQAKKVGKKRKTKAEEAEIERQKEEAARQAEEEQKAQNHTQEKKLKPTHNNENPYLNAVPQRKGHKKMETELDEEYDQIMRIELEYEKE